MDNREIELQALITERDGMIMQNKNCINRNKHIVYTYKSFADIAQKMRALKDPCATVTLPKNLDDLPKGEPLPSVEVDGPKADGPEADVNTLLSLLEYVLSEVYNRRTVDKIRDTIELVRGHRR